MPLLPRPIPSEIIDTIIDELHDDTANLKTCSLVTRQFTPRSQYHLLKSITIDFWNPRQKRRHHKAQPLLDVLSKSDRLAGCIRHLTLLNYSEGFLDIRTGEFRREDEVLPLLFKKLHKLLSFKLIIDEATGSRSRGISKSLTSAVVAMIQSNPVVELTLWNLVDFPMTFLALHCPELKRLTFRGSINGMDLVTEEVPAIDHRGAINTKGDLRVLDIDCVSAPHIDLLYKTSQLAQSKLSLAHLQELSVTRLHENTVELVSKVVTDAADTLEQFTWDDAGYATPAPDFRSHSMSLAFPSKPTSLKFAFRHYHNQVPHHLYWLSTGLERTITGTKRLKTLEIIFVLDFPYDFGTETLWDECDIWASAFDAFLAGPANPDLDNVKICIVYPDNGSYLPPRYRTEVVTLLEKKLPLLMTKEVLRLDLNCLEMMFDS